MSIGPISGHDYWKSAAPPDREDALRSKKVTGDCAECSSWDVCEEFGSARCPFLDEAREEEEDDAWP